MKMEHDPPLRDKHQNAGKDRKDLEYLMEDLVKYREQGNADGIRYRRRAVLAHYLIAAGELEPKK